MPSSIDERVRQVVGEGVWKRIAIWNAIATAVSTSPFREKSVRLDRWPAASRGSALAALCGPLCERQ